MEIDDLITGFISKLQQKNKIDAQVTGIVLEVQENTCTVQRENAPTLYKVRLTAIEDEVGSFIKIKPRLGSVVLCGIIEGLQAEASVLQCSEIDEVQIIVGNKEYKINQDGHLIKGGDDTLKEALELIIEAIEFIIVLKGRNPDRVKLEEAKNKLQNILQ